MVFYFTCSDPRYTIYMGRDKYENEELIKSFNSGRAFLGSGQKFDPQRNTRNNAERDAPGGQTWSSLGPRTWSTGMRDCHFCKDRDCPKADKQHTDISCTYASKEQKDALKKERDDALAENATRAS